MDLNENYKQLISAVLLRYVRDYVSSYVYLKKHTKNSLEDKIKRSESALRRVAAEYDINSKEYKDAKRILTSYRWKLACFNRAEYTVGNARYDIEEGLIGFCCGVLGYKFDDTDSLINMLTYLAEDSTQRRKILKKGKEVKKLIYD